MRKPLSSPGTEDDDYDDDDPGLAVTGAQFP